ncbi:ciliary microtubule inner protein 2B-like [Clavelina lepadiformis]|uniref:Ciliary microtubule inner protein 2B n=1 Tax=Clavelina lepadiformis TaxID=159417 RepID=A0ABP0FGY4_CLALP
MLCPDPYYPPGYCGYSPQFQFQFGETYGETTARLLKDPNVAKSGRLVLADIIPKKCHDDCKTNKNEWLRYRKQSWGDRKLIGEMVPGYTGYIPKERGNFGMRYAQSCNEAIAGYTKDRTAYDNKRRSIIHKAPRVPLRAEPKPYVSLNQVDHSVSPYFMNTGDPAKTFMSGYTGFIPRSRSRFGLVYPKLTQESLVDFTKAQQQLKLREMSPLVMQQATLSRNQAKKPKGGQPIYVDNGLLPHYTGYLPGHKFRNGVTFGTSSRYFNAVAHHRNRLQSM